MKKILFIIFLQMMFSPLSAQSLPDDSLTDGNFQYKIHLLLQQATQGKNQAINQQLISDQTQNGRAQHPWQILMFLAEHDRPLAETLNQLRSRIQQGVLMQATVLITPRVKDPDTLKIEKMYFIYNDGEKPITQSFDASYVTQTEELLSMLAKNLQENNPDLYTAMVVDAHGNGATMKYKLHQEENTFSVVNLLQIFEQKQTKLDLLVLDSCGMSSFFSLYYLTQTDMVDYLVASSDTMYVAADVMYYHVLRFLNYEPREAAVRSVRYRPRFLHFDSSWHTTNASALDLQLLRGKFQDWLNEYYALTERIPTTQQATTTWFSTPKTIRSVTHTLIHQQRYLQEHAKELTGTKSLSDCHNLDIINTFIQKSRSLMDALHIATLTQWCYSPQEDRLYWEDIPDDECLGSVSMSLYQLELVLEQEKNKLAQYSHQQYACRFHF